MSSKLEAKTVQKHTTHSSSWAANDRIDEMVPFELPERQQRVDLLKSHLTAQLLGNDGATPITVDIWGENGEDVHGLIEEAADATKGFSGRQIAKLAVACQAAAYGQTDATLDADTFRETLASHVEQAAVKESWEAEAMREYSAKSS